MAIAMDRACALTRSGARHRPDRRPRVAAVLSPTAGLHFQSAVGLFLRILETGCEGPLLAATFHGCRHALTTAALLRSFFSLPLVTFKIVAAIHREALRLWLKGARLVQRVDAAPANTAFNSGLAIRKHADYTGTTLSAAGREPGSRESALVQ
jgi:uncharacterized protein